MQGRRVRLPPRAHKEFRKGTLDGRDPSDRLCVPISHLVPDSPHVLPSFDSNTVEERVLNEVVFVGRPTVANVDLVARFEDRPPLSATTPFTVELKIDGQVVKSASGNAGESLQEVFSFDVPLPGSAGTPPEPRKP